MGEIQYAQIHQPGISGLPMRNPPHMKKTRMKTKPMVLARIMDLHQE